MTLGGLTELFSASKLQCATASPTLYKYTPHIKHTSIILPNNSGVFTIDWPLEPLFSIKLCKVGP